MKKQTEKIQLTVEDEGKDQRIDKYISSVLTQFSRSSIKSWIETGNILLDDSRVKPKTLLYPGQAIVVMHQFQES